MGDTTMSSTQSTFESGVMANDSTYVLEGDRRSRGLMTFVVLHDCWKDKDGNQITKVRQITPLGKCVEGLITKQELEEMTLIKRSWEHVDTERW